jgi:hypothetical protein
MGQRRRAILEYISTISNTFNPNDSNLIESASVCFLINDSVHELIILHRSDWFLVFARA